MPFFCHSLTRGHLLILSVAFTEYLLWARHCPQWLQIFRSISGSLPPLYTSKQGWQIRKKKMNILSTSFWVFFPKFVSIINHMILGWMEWKSQQITASALSLFLPPFLFSGCTEVESLVSQLRLFSGENFVKVSLNFLLNLFFHIKFKKFSQLTSNPWRASSRTLGNRIHSFLHSFCAKCKMLSWGLSKVQK